LNSSVGSRPVEPFYFDSSDRQLFGCYHAPLSGSGQGCGVVLCHPMGEEYIRFHRAYRLLSDRLAGAGFPVLRFDLYGCGDSSGESKQGQIGHWCTDVAAAVGEMRRRGDVTKVCLVGLRLGASLSMLVGAERGDIDGMVLWDAVISGRDYVEELIASHQEMLQHAHVEPRRDAAVKDDTEILGFPLTASMRSELEELDLLAVQRRPAHNILVIESNEKASQGQLLRHLEGIGANLTHQRLLNPRLWVWEEAVGRILVAPQILQSVVSWISEVYA
jgi:pimeloyl-ACP methyl ester carboxylesterase